MSLGILGVNRSPSCIATMWLYSPLFSHFQFHLLDFTTKTLNEVKSVSRQLGKLLKEPVGKVPLLW